jgi:hypothetical protein
MECGEGHPDQGSFVLTAYGEHLVDDIGYGGWEATSEAHSVVLIDEEGQQKGGMLGGINDRRVGQVDDSGQVTIPAGAFTIRR